MLRTRTGSPVTESQISSWERGEMAPEPSKREEIARVLRTTPGAIFGEPEDPNLIKRLTLVERQVAAIIQIEGLGDAIEAMLRRWPRDTRDVLEQIANDAPIPAGASVVEDETGQVPGAARRPK